MRVLIACEFSGVVRDAFTALGHDAVSCDLLPSDSPGAHYQGDVRDILADRWDLMVAFPPCTHLCISGARWFSQKQQEQREAVEFVRTLITAPIPRICIENPVGVLSTRLGPPSQIIQPWQFGHEAQKTTCLWLRGLPCLVPTETVGRGDFVILKSGKRMPSWYYLPETDDRWKQRSVTFPGIATAMAEQWGSSILPEGAIRQEVLL